MKNNLYSFLVLFLFGLSAMAQPTDNPYRTRYAADLPSVPYHWTDSLPWTKVIPITNYSNLVKRVRDFSSNFEEDMLNDWQLAFYAAQDSAVKVGGGVVYFPTLPDRQAIPGTDSSYYFSDHLKLKSNIVLRGPTPSAIDARINTFCPPAFLEFPKYIYRGDVSINTGNNTAFKEITIDTTGITGIGKTGFRNIAIVYLDINRARIAAHPTFINVGNNIGLANEKPRNILILGVRSNNVAIPDVNVPTEILSAGSKPWHRWPWRFGSNIDLYVSANAIIVGCRLNDYQNNSNSKRLIQSDDFPQSGYKPSGFGTTPQCSPTPEQAKFDYNRHYGIILNRLKKVGYNSVLGFVTNSLPAQEPELYAPGNVIMDNWLFKTSRAGIHAAGSGLLIKGNVTKDILNKSTIIDVVGQRCLNPDFGTGTPPTFENRGIDFVGWDVNIIGNETEVYRIKLLPSNAYSTDGESWYFQGSGGGTARNVLISGNKSIGNPEGLCDALSSSNKKGFNGFANTINLQNIKVINNDFAGIPFRIQAQGNPPSNYNIQGLLVTGNTNLHSIEVVASGCGDSATVFGNTKISGSVQACGVQDLNIDCFTSLNSDVTKRNENGNVGFTTYPSNPNGDDRPGCATVCPQGSPACGFPSVRISALDPIKPYITGQSIFVTVEYALISPQQCVPDSIVLYKNAGERVEKVETGLSPSTGQQTFTLYKAGDNNERIYAIVYINGFFGQSVSVPIVVGIDPYVISQAQVKMYPNPAKRMVNFEIDALVGSGTIQISDLLGRVLDQSKFALGQSSIDVSGLAKGTYMVQFGINKQKITKRLIID